MLTPLGPSGAGFGGNPDNGIIGAHVTVRTEVNNVRPADYKGIIAIGAYAMDRLRYQAIRQGQQNKAPAVVFVRKAKPENALWNDVPLAVAVVRGPVPPERAPRDLRPQHHLRRRECRCGRGVRGGRDGDLVVDGNLITGKHPGVTDRFMAAFVHEIESRAATPAGP